MENEVKPIDQRIKSIIIERIKRNGIPINEWWLTLIIALFGQKMFNENEMREIVEELKKRVEEDGEPS